MIAEYDTSQWVQNMRASGDVGVRVGSSSFPARARILSEEQDSDLLQAVQQLSREKYGWGEGTVVELTPVLATSSDQGPHA